MPPWRCWQPGAIDRFVGDRELVAPEGVREYFGELFAAFPDFSLEVVELTTAHSRTAVRWRGRGTFAGPGAFQGFEPNGARVELEGCDVITAHGELIEHNDAFVNTAATWHASSGSCPRPGQRRSAGWRRRRTSAPGSAARSTARASSGSPRACGSSRADCPGG